MRIRITLAAAVAMTALPGAASAEHAGYLRPQTYFYYYTDSTPYPKRDYSDDRAYDHARVYFRTHGKWPDGRTRAEWRRGQIAPLSIAQNAPVVDWRAASLSAPRQGYQWRKVGEDYLLIGDVSRLIASVVLATS